MRALVVSSAIAALAALACAGCQNSGDVLTSPPDAGPPPGACAQPDCCVKNQECMDRHAGAPFVCRASDQQCVSLTTSECPTVLAEKDDLLDGAPVVIGALFGSDDVGHVSSEAVALARMEIKRTGGLDFTRNGQRALVVVACTGGADDRDPVGRGAAIRGVSHLVRDLHVAAIVAGGAPSTMVELAETIAIPNGTAFLATTATAPRLSALDDADLVWRLAASDIVTAKAVAPFVAGYLEARAVYERVTSAGEVRVAIVHDGPAAAAEVAAIEETLHFNGAPARANGAKLAIVDAGEALTNARDALAQIAAFEPTIIVHVTPGIGVGLVAPIEQTWPDGTPRPYHVGARTEWVSALRAAVAQDAALRRRTFALGALPVGFMEQTVRGFEGDLEVFAPDLAKANIPDAAMDAYDATYLVAYAAMGAKDVLDGAAVAKGLHRFATPGQVIPFGINGLALARETLTRGDETIDYRGVRGGMYFDAAGDRRYDALAYCWQADGTLVPSGFRVSGLDGTASGAPVCE